MENYREFTKDTTVARMIFREIKNSGIGYLSMKGAGENRDLLLGMGVAELYAAGAKTIYCGFKNDGLMKLPNTCGFLVWEQFYSHAHDMDALEIDLRDRQEQNDALSFVFESLSRENAPRYKQLYNLGFAAVPNFATCEEDSILDLLAGDAHGELVYLNGEAVGVLETSVEDGVGMIDGIALIPKHCGQGKGRALLRQVLTRFQKAGFQKAALLVSSANPAAYRLYLSEGFVKTKLYSRWFKLEMGE